MEPETMVAVATDPSTFEAAAAALALLSEPVPEAGAALRRAGGAESHLATALRGGVTVLRPQPAGEQVEIGGRQVTTYSADDVLRANLPDFIEAELEDLIANWLPLLERWLPDVRAGISTGVASDAATVPGGGGRVD